MKLWLGGASLVACFVSAISLLHSKCAQGNRFARRAYNRPKL